MKNKKKNKSFKNKRKTQNDDSLLVVNHTRMPYFFYLPSNEFWSRNYFVHKDPINSSVIKE